MRDILHGSAAYCYLAVVGAASAWTNGQIERMNRTIKEATVTRYHYVRHNMLRTHLAEFLNACTFACRLKMMRGPAPCDYSIRPLT